MLCVIRLSTSENNELQIELRWHANTAVTFEAGLTLMREKSSLKGSFGCPLQGCGAAGGNGEWTLEGVINQ